MSTVAHRLAAPLLLSCWMLLSCWSGGAWAQAPGGPPPAVSVSAPLKRDVTEWLEYTGQFAAPEFVEIRARVSGYLTDALFKDGQLVNKGDVLFAIDSRQYEIELQQAEAQRDVAAANIEYSARDVSRGAALRQNDNLAASNYDQRVQQLKTATAALSAANAAIRQARLNLDYSRVTSPVTGRIGASQVSRGNLIIAGGNSASSTLLTTVVSTSPIWFNFDMSESDFLVYQRAVSQGKLGSPRADGTIAQLRLDDERDWKRIGKVDFVDNQIDRSSGTIRVRATFENADMFITPGQFGRVRLPASEPHSTLLVPDAAVTTDQSRKVVMTVDATGTVVAKVVQPGPLSDGLRVIRSGLEATDQVVIDGLLRARPGAKVTPQPGTIAAAS